MVIRFTMIKPNLIPHQVVQNKSSLCLAVLSTFTSDLWSRIYLKISGIGSSYTGSLDLTFFLSRQKNSTSSGPASVTL